LKRVGGSESVINTFSGLVLLLAQVWAQSCLLC